jgi:hypothetical protein
VVNNELAAIDSGQRDVGRVVSAEVVPQLPHPRPQRLGRESGQRQRSESGQRGAGLFIGEIAASDKPSQHVGDLTVDQVRHRQVLAITVPQP